MKIGPFPECQVLILIGLLDCQSKWSEVSDQIGDKLNVGVSDATTATTALTGTPNFLMCKFPTTVQGPKASQSKKMMKTFLH